MPDATSYASTLYAHTATQNQAAIVEALDALATLARQKRASLAALPLDRLPELLPSHHQARACVAVLLARLKADRTLALLPNIAIAYRRVLRRHDHPVFEVTLSESVEPDYFRSRFGQRSVIIERLDPKLGAGVRIVSPEGTYELSLDLLLKRVQETLAV